MTILISSMYVNMGFCWSISKSRRVMPREESKYTGSQSGDKKEWLD